MRVVIIILITVFSYGNIDESKPAFCNGWDEGYKRGWCYNTYRLDYCTATVIVPHCPIPRFNEDRNSYKDGYDRGFSTAIYKRQFEKSM